jgi:hypothetical protein
MVDLITDHPPWLVAEVVTALVRGHDTIACSSQRRDLVPPTVPALGESVQQDRQWTVLRPGQNCVEAQAIHP